MVDARFCKRVLSPSNMDRSFSFDESSPYMDRAFSPFFSDMLIEADALRSDPVLQGPLSPAADRGAIAQSSSFSPIWTDNYGGPSMASKRPRNDQLPPL